MNQTTKAIKCMRHPGDVVVVIMVAEVCEYPSRLACFKCLQEYQNIDKYVDFQRFKVDLEDIINVAANYGPEFSRDIHYYYNILGKGLITTQLTFVNQLIKLLQSVKQGIKDIVSQYNNYSFQLSELKQNFLDKLNLINIELNNIVELEDYHESQEWKTLEVNISKYIGLFYGNEDQDINQAIVKVQIPAQDMISIQSKFQVVCDKIVVEMNKLISYTENQAMNLKLDSELIPKQFNKTLKSQFTNLTKFKLLYKGSQHGLSAKIFWQKCQNQGPTLVICKSKSGQVFGGYSPCRWISDCTYQQDKTLKSFLFQANRNEIYQLKYSDNAIYGSPDSGPIYGGAYDLCLANDFQNGSSKLSNQYYSTGKYKVENVNTYLMNATKPELVDIEVYLVEN